VTKTRVVPNQILVCVALLEQLHVESKRLALEVALSSSSRDRLALSNDVLRNAEQVVKLGKLMLLCGQAMKREGTGATKPPH